VVTPAALLLLLVVTTSLLSLAAIEITTTSITNQVTLASSNFTQTANLTNGLLQDGTTVQTRDIGSEAGLTRTNQTTTISTENQTSAEALPLPPLIGRHYVPIQGEIARVFWSG
jgi:hypothetical protein